MKPAAFEYHQPTTAAEAVGLLHELGDGAKVIAGGQSLVPILALRLAVFEHLVDVARIEAIRGIERRNGTLWVGAGTTDAAVEASSEVAASAPLLAKATPLIGHFQIRNRGTVGGSLAHADPAAEYPAVVLALDAQMEVLGSQGTRIVEAADFFTGFWETEVAADELLTGISFPVWSGRCGFAIEEVARRHGDFAMAGAAGAIRLDGDGRCAEVRLAFFGVGPTPVRLPEAEAFLRGRRLDEATLTDLARLVSDRVDPDSDVHAGGDYRKHLAGVLAKRVVLAAARDAGEAAA